MATELDARQQARLEAAGLGRIPTRQGLDALELLLQAERAQAVVMPVDWPRFLARFSGGEMPPLFAPFADLAERRPAQQDGLREQLRQMPAANRKSLLINLVRSHVAQVLGMAALEQIGLRRRLFDLGVDSLMAVELKNRLQSELGCSLRPTLLFDHPTVEAIADFLAKLLIPDDAEGPEPLEVGRSAINIDSLRELSDEAVDELFAKMSEDAAG